MNFPVEAYCRYSAAELAAAEWAILHDGGLSAEQQKQFEAWIEADPEHAQAFAALDETWSVLDRVRELRAADQIADPDALAPLRLKSRPSPSLLRVLRPWPVRWTTMAAAVIFSLVGWWYLSSLGHYTQAASTEIGGVRKIALPDGSIMQLNTASAAEVYYSPSERRVNLLKGEAHFRVEKNRKRPFIVNVRGVDIRAVGTAFNVRLRSESVEVLVTEGKVQVDDSIKGGSLLAESTALSASAIGKNTEQPPETPLLAAGELAVISLTANSVRIPVVPISVPPLHMQRALAWQEHRLEFSSVTLEEMVAEFNRYNRHRLVIADSRLAAQHFGGNFDSDGYETLVHLLEANYGVIVERHADETVLRLP